MRTHPLSAVGGVVFSRDRALQLAAFLDSADRRARSLIGNTTIVYRATSADFARAYQALRDEWPGVDWREERSFRDDVLASVRPKPFVMFHTDDDLYFDEVDGFQFGDDVACFSFRLGLNTTYCYPLDFQESVEPVRAGRSWIAWRWREHGNGAFGYPLALNGHVLRRDDVERWLAESQFSNPNELEVALQRFLDELPPLMASFRTSRLVNVPANLVNESYANRHAGMHTTSELNERFLRGERIDLAAMDFSGVHAAHEERAFAFASR